MTSPTVSKGHAEHFIEYTTIFENFSIKKLTAFEITMVEPTIIN